MGTLAKITIAKSLFHVHLEVSVGVPGEDIRLLPQVMRTIWNNNGALSYMDAPATPRRISSAIAYCLGISPGLVGIVKGKELLSQMTSKIDRVIPWPSWEQSLQQKIVANKVVVVIMDDSYDDEVLDLVINDDEGNPLDLNDDDYRGDELSWENGSWEYRGVPVVSADHLGELIASAISYHYQKAYSGLLVKGGRLLQKTPPNLDKK